MKKAILTTGVVVTAAMLLSGCSVMRSLGFGGGKPKAQQAAADMPGMPQGGFTEIGRTQLAQGNFGLASETFQRALAAGEPRGTALNGLGVAYARIGRADLAARFFRMAMEAEPANERYAANLSALLKANTFEEALPRQALAPTPVPAAQPASSQAQRGRLVRVSPREFQIRIAGATPAKGQTAMLEKQFRPVVRVKLAGKVSAPVADANAATITTAAPVKAAR